MIKENFRERLHKDEDIEGVYHEYLQGNDVWYLSEYLKCQNPSKTYDAIKILIARKLGISMQEIAIVGSAKLGFSISPTSDKAYRDFCFEHDDPNEISDIDLGIVNSALFNKIWNAYFELKYSKGLPHKDYIFLSKSVFKKFLMVSPNVRNHPILEDWFKKIEPCIKDLQLIHGIQHQVNYRIYDSWDAMRKYHIKGLEDLKKMK